MRGKEWKKAKEKSRKYPKGQKFDTFREDFQSKTRHDSIRTTTIYVQLVLPAEIEQIWLFCVHEIGGKE